MSTIKLFKIAADSHERKSLGTITDNDLDCLAANLEEEFEEDEDYYIDISTIEYLKDQGASDHLLALLEKAVEGEEQGVEIAYQIF